MERKQVDLMMGGMELLTLMSEGNPGALRVLMELFAADPMMILCLDDMNIRGWQIWVGYKDYCNCDLPKFIENIQNRNEEMIETINSQRGFEGPLAVVAGASRR